MIEELAEVGLVAAVGGEVTPAARFVDCVGRTGTEMEQEEEHEMQEKRRAAISVKSTDVISVQNKAEDLFWTEPLRRLSEDPELLRSTKLCCQLKVHTVHILFRYFLKHIIF